MTEGTDETDSDTCPTLVCGLPEGVFAQILDLVDLRDVRALFQTCTATRNAVLRCIHGVCYAVAHGSNHLQLSVAGTRDAPLPIALQGMRTINGVIQLASQKPWTAVSLLWLTSTDSGTIQDAQLAQRCMPLLPLAFPRLSQLSLEGVTGIIPSHIAALAACSSLTHLTLDDVRFGAPPGAAAAGQLSLTASHSQPAAAASSSGHASLFTPLSAADQALVSGLSEPAAAAAASTSRALALMPGPETPAAPPPSLFYDINPQEEVDALMNSIGLLASLPSLCSLSLHLSSTSCSSSQGGMHLDNLSALAGQLTHLLIGADPGTWSALVPQNRLWRIGNHVVDAWAGGQPARRLAGSWEGVQQLMLPAAWTAGEEQAGPQHAAPHHHATRLALEAAGAAGPGPGPGSSSHRRSGSSGSGSSGPSSYATGRQDGDTAGTLAERSGSGAGGSSQSEPDSDAYAEGLQNLHLASESQEALWASFTGAPLPPARKHPHVPASTAAAVDDDSEDAVALALLQQAGGEPSHAVAGGSGQEGGAQAGARRGHSHHSRHSSSGDSGGSSDSGPWQVAAQGGPGGGHQAGLMRLLQSMGVAIDQPLPQQRTPAAAAPSTSAAGSPPAPPAGPWSQLAPAPSLPAGTALVPAAPRAPSIPLSAPATLMASNPGTSRGLTLQVTEPPSPPPDPWAAAGLPLCALTGLRVLQLEGLSKELGEGYLGPLADACKSLGRLEMCSTSVDGRGLCALMRGLPSLAHLGVHSVCAPMPDNGGAPLDAPPTFASLSLGLLAPTCELDVRVAARLPLAQLTETLELHSLTLVIGQSLDGQEAAAELAAAAHNLATACTTLRLRDCSLKLVCHGRMRGHGRGLLGAPLLQGLAPFAPHVRNLAIQGPGAGPDGLCLGGEELWTLAELWEPYGGLRELSVTGCDLERSFWSVICEALVSLRVLELGAACSGAVGATDLAHFCMHMPSTLELRAAGLAQQQQAMTNMALVTLQALEALAFQ